MEKWYHYLYGKQDITVNSDNQPLETISKKPLSRVPRGFTEWCWGYRTITSISRGSQWWTRVRLRNNAKVRCISCGSHTDGPVTKPCRMDQIREKTVDDTEQSGWWLDLPNERRTEWNQSLLGLHRWDFVFDGVLFKSHQVIVPASLRPERLQKIHKAHQDADSSIRRARESVYWPAMQAASSSCGVCSQYLRERPQEPMQSHTIPSRPWERVSADLYRLDGSNYLVLMDHYSDYIELEP